MTNEASPRPWRVEDSDTIRDAEGCVVVSALNPCNRATRRLIVAAVNERDRLAADEARYRTQNVVLCALVRRLCDELESHYYEPQSKNDRSIIRQARAALGEAAP